MTPAMIEAENSKKTNDSMDAVYRKLAGYDVTLIKGNTRETLAQFNEPVDFVWLDGGHSVETIRSDRNNVKRVLAPGAEVWFDDYFTFGPDTTRWGCNEIVKDLKHEIHFQCDLVKGGGHTQMVRVYP